MSLSLKVDTTDFNRAMRDYARVANRSAEQAALRAFRGFMRRVIGITPPANQASARGEGGTLTKADQKRGISAIAGDLGRLFIGKRIKGKRAEQWPDVAALHREAFIKFKQPGKAIRSPLGRGRFFYVDQRKLDAHRRKLEAHTGRLAAGWLPGAQALKVAVPAWVKRHGNRGGAHRLILKNGDFSLMVAHTAVPAGIVSDMSRRMDYALLYAANALRRETQAILQKFRR